MGYLTMKNLFLAALLALAVTPAAFAVPKETPDYAAVNNAKSGDSETYDEDSDPIEPVNRGIQKFNDVVDTVVYKPVSRTYRYVVPQWGRNRVSNVFYNLSEPLTVVNSALQADPKNTFTSLWRFILNSTFGVLGIFDVAESFGLKPRQEDFGQTMAVWGWRNSSYFVIPFIGPSTLRDALGMGVDVAANPVYWPLDEREQIGLFVADALDRRTKLLPVTDEIERTSLDPYASYRSIYLQERKNDISNGRLTPAY